MEHEVHILYMTVYVRKPCFSYNPWNEQILNKYKNLKSDLLHLSTKKK